jgi:uncharacterized damage-inducible protein DinB
MRLADAFLQQLARESDRSRRALEEMPEDQADWTPHEKSMAFGYLAQLVAIMPNWVAMQVSQPELDLAPKDGKGYQPEPLSTRADYLAALEAATLAARRALEGATDEHLMTPWRLLVGGTVVAEAPRHEMIQDTFTHLAHHRGQMTVYLRLLGATVPALYGPSADDRSFA